MMERKLCEGGIEIDDGPCHKCGRLPSQSCGSPLPDPRDAEIERLRQGWRHYMLAHGMFPDMADKVIDEALRGEGE